MKLIDKDALVAEIKKKIRTEQGYSSGDAECGYRDCASEILSFLDTLEVKEVDSDEIKIGETQIYIEDDGGEPPYDGKQWLDLECLEYEISKDKFKDGDNVEIILRKIQKGE